MKHIFLLISLFFSFVSSAQFTILSQKKIGGSGDDDLGLFYTHDSTGYYLVGTSNSNASFDKSENSRGWNDLWIVKTDLNFNILWDKTIGGDQDETMLASVITDTAIYCLLNTYSNATGDMTVSNYGSTDFWLLKLDLNGNILMQENYGGSGIEGSGKLLEKDNHLLLVGTSNSPISGNKSIAPIGGGDIWLLEIDPTDFSILNEKVIGSPQQDGCYGVVKTNSNNWYISSNTSEGIGGDKTDVGFGDTDYWIIKLDENLNVLADKCFGGTSTENFPTLSTDGDHIYINGISYSEQNGNKTAPNRGSFDGFTRPDIWTVKIDENLNVIWDKSFGGTNDEYAGKVTFLNNNLLSISGVSYSQSNSGNKTAPLYGNCDGWIIITDSDGNMNTQYSLGGTGIDIVGVSSQRGDTLSCGGSTYSPISGNQTTGSNGGDFWAVTLKINNLSAPNFTENESTLQVFPNPFHDQVTFEFGNPLEQNQTIRIYGTDGKLVDELSVQQGVSSIHWNPTCDGGIYYYGVGSVKGKVIFQKK